jgi:hypothetical protein
MSGPAYLVMVVAALIVAWVFYVVLRSAYRRLGSFGLILAIAAEACALGGFVYWINLQVPGIIETTMGLQVGLAILGLVLAVVIGGGLMVALGGHKR